MRLLILISSLLFISSCTSKKTDKSDSLKQPVTSDDLVDKLIDSITKIKPMELSFQVEQADFDDLIPIGYNEEGSIAYFVIENTSARNAVRLQIGPGFGLLTLNSGFETDLLLDSILKVHKNMIYYNLKAAQIKIDPNFRKLSLDSFQLKYKYRFDIRKTMGAPSTDSYRDKKTLASVSMQFDEGNNYMNTIINSRFKPADEIYDMYISDCLIVPGRDSEFGFLVVVTEKLGAESDIRNSIELIGLGSLKK